MALVRELAEAVHAMRSEAGQKLRQPLASAAVRGASLGASLAEVLAAEVNVAEVLTLAEGQELPAGGDWLSRQLASGATVWLRVDLNDELRAAGAVREFTRQVNSLRKAQGLTVGDRVTLTVAAPAELRAALEGARAQVLAATLAEAIEFTEAASGEAVKVGEHQATVKLGRA
jgi:hypothetical protein